jgi:hypothetical protein
LNAILNSLDGVCAPGELLLAPVAITRPAAILADATGLPELTTGQFANMTLESAGGLLSPDPKC